MIDELKNKGHGYKNEVKHEKYHCVYSNIVPEFNNRRE